MSIDKRVAGLIATILVGFGLLVFFLMVLRENVNNPVSRNGATPTQVPAQPDTTGGQNATSSNYTSATLGINLQYPFDMKYQEHDDGSVTFYSTGKSQSEDAEIFDGIILNIKKATHDAANLRAFVDSEQQRIGGEAITEKITEVTQKSYGDKSGYEFTATTIGDFRYFYLDKGSKEYLLLTMVVADPQNTGYENQLEEIISGLSY